ncbi:glutathione peroxidase [Suhomyces tanzawaensis NRRL Y-17324]|uniref:Glutathione peroxidase n=1 Tax=Suhomyces tanzawaensis NRRL Y-17324 TaxID=984487 RepID=A0A1E4SPD5_9ASCO|nr:glutathione peroxidase [Suhomyces tanzawaensis NRRL Y-17324]ODV81373.1 glutathione peroxidase [Suhomyces tanzawaensis NRRL Y-17324]
MVSTDGNISPSVPQSVFYTFTLTRSDGVPVYFSQLRNKVVIVVNVASLCGFTPQYQEFQQLHEKYKHRGLVILAFPCNQFGSQEPEDALAVQAFAHKHYGVTFPIMNKLLVNGDRESKLYKWLKDEKKGDMGFRGVRWNFEKFVVNKRGQVVARYPSGVTPLQFESQLVDLLDEI